MRTQTIALTLCAALACAPVAQASPIYDSGLVVPAPHGAAGTLLATTPLDPNVGLGSAAAQYRFAYTTTNQHDAPAVSTGAIFVPRGTPPAGGWPVIAWAHGTVGLGSECAPSLNPRSPRDAEYLNRWLDEGYAIVASDYTGLGSPGFHSYLNGAVAAANVADSVAAAHQLPEIGLSPQWSVVGQSQGGGVALHVAHRATRLSEELGLDYRGAVATGAPAYIENLIIAGGPTFPPVALPAGLTTYALYIVAALNEAYPELDIDSALTDEGRALVAEASTGCYAKVAETSRGVNLSRAFNRPLRDIPGFEQAAREFTSTPVAGYDKPVFLGHGLHDIDVPSPIGVMLGAEMWLRQFDSNAQVVVRFYPTDHSGTVNASTVDSVPFLRSLNQS